MCIVSYLGLFPRTSTPFTTGMYLNPQGARIAFRYKFRWNRLISILNNAKNTRSARPAVRTCVSQSGSAASSARLLRSELYLPLFMNPSLSMNNHSFFLIIIDSLIIELFYFSCKAVQWQRLALSLQVPNVYCGSGHFGLSYRYSNFETNEWFVHAMRTKSLSATLGVHFWDWQDLPLNHLKTMQGLQDLTILQETKSNSR